MFRVVLLVLALVAAGTATWIAYGRLGGKGETANQSAAAPEPTVEILVAASDIGLGESIKPGDFTWQAWPERLTNGAYVRRAQQPDAPDTFVDAIARGRFVAGEPVLSAKLALDARGLMAAMLDAGERALAVSVSAETAAGGFVLPGDRVDVLLIESRTDVDGRRISEATTILRDIEVLAIDQSAEAEENGAVIAKTATLRLNEGESEAETLLAAQARGHLTLALRAIADRGRERSSVTPAAETPDRVVIVRRRGVVETVAVP